MVQSGVRLTGDTSGLSTSIQSVVKDVDKLNEGLQTTSDLTGKVSNVNLNVSPGSQNDGYSANVTQALTTVSQSQQQVAQVIQTSSNNQKQIAQNNGNGGGGAGGVMSSVAQDVIMNQGSGLTKILGALGVGGLAAGGIFTALSAANKLSNQWLKANDVLDTYAVLGNGVENLSAKENSDQMIDLFGKVADKRAASGTRYKTDEYLKEMASLGQYGYGDTSEALNATDKIFRWQNFGAGSRGQLSSFQGLAHRYGLGEDAIQAAYAGMRAQGMEKGQFDEFLSSMEDILEDGIEKGFTRGIKETSADLRMLQTLSGNSEFWTGKNGAERLQRMNSAMENATNLGSVNDIVLYQALSGLGEGAKKSILGKDARGNEIYDDRLGYINNMMLLERGINSDNIGAVFGAVNGMGGTQIDAIERYKSMFGVNYTTAKQIYDLSQNYSDDTKDQVMKEIDKLKTDPKNQSLEQQYLNTQEKIRDEVVKIGGNLYDIKAGLFSSEVDDQGVNAAVVDTNYSAFNGVEWIGGKEVSENERIKLLLQDYQYGGEGNFANQEELYAAYNAFMSDPYMAQVLDMQNIQNRSDLRDAWELKRANEFLNNLLGKNPELEFENTSFGPIAKEEVEWLRAKNNPEVNKMLGFTAEEVVKLFKALKDNGADGMLTNNGGMADQILQVANLISEKPIILEMVTGH